MCAANIEVNLEFFQIRSIAFKHFILKCSQCGFKKNTMFGEVRAAHSGCRLKGFQMECKS